MPRTRSTASLRRLRSDSDMNISATQVLLQSNLSASSRETAARRTACRFAPHDLQNFNSSLWVEPHCGQNMVRSFPPVRLKVRRNARAGFEGARVRAFKSGKTRDVPTRVEHARAFKKYGPSVLAFE